MDPPVGELELLALGATPARPGMILAGDVGGTKTHLALFAPGPPLRALRVETYHSAAFSSLDAMIDQFRGEDAVPVTAAALGVAGPIIGATAILPNLAWSVDGARIADRLALAGVLLLNDVEASVWSLELLGPGDTVVLQPGTAAPNGSQGVISAGTGLGEAILLRAGTHRSAVATEAGHADFAPRTDLEIELFRWLRERFGRVSWERILSGPGLVNVHAFLSATDRGTEPPSVSEAMREGDPAAVISAAALDGTSERCALALDLFTAIYGAEAGNLVLRAVATGGLFLGGGIAPKILPWLRREPFLQAFLAKGRLSPLLAATPVHVILDQRAALLGAARVAASVGPREDEPFPSLSPG